MPNAMHAYKVFDRASVRIEIEYQDRLDAPYTDICEFIEATADAAAVLFGIVGATDTPQGTDETGGETITITAKPGVNPQRLKAAIGESFGGDIHAVQLGDTPRPRLRGRIPGAI